MVLLLALSLLFGAGGAQAGDWPQWRGPARDAFSPEVPLKLPAKRLLWRRPLAGKAHAGIAVAGGFVVVPDWKPGTDFIRCFDAKTGKPLWTHSYPNAGEMEWGAGPRATPLIHAGRVYTLGAMGDLTCLELTTGKVVWHRSLPAEFGAKVPKWGYSSSPLLADGRLIINPGGEKAGLAALNPATGATLWQGAAGLPAYGSFIVGTFGGVRQLVGYDQASLGGWDPATGRRLWSLTPSKEDYNVGTPVAVGDKLLVCSQASGARLYAFSPDGTLQPEPIAANRKLAPDAGSLVAAGGLVFGASSGLACLDASTLKMLWRNDQEDALCGFCMLLAGNGRVLVLSESGTLFLVAAERSGCRILGRMRVCGSTWSHPALAAGRLYVRDESWVYCYGM